MSACPDLPKKIAYFQTFDPKIVKKVKKEDFQYDLFQTIEETEMEILQKKVDKINYSCHAVRRGTYALINEQRKLIEEMMSRLEHIERGLCYGK